MRDKLYGYGLHFDEVEELISRLISEGFINEVRFAQSYVRGKYRLKKWGRIKIKLGLDAQKLTPRCIEKGMAEIDEDEYLANLKSLAEKKASLIKEKDPYIFRKKLQTFLQGKGYEFDLIREVIDGLSEF